MDAKTIKDAMEALEKEVQTEGGVLESPRDYRVQLTKTLLYKVPIETKTKKVYLIMSLKISKPHYYVKNCYLADNFRNYW